MRVQIVEEDDVQVHHARAVPERLGTADVLFHLLEQLEESTWCERCLHLDDFS